MNEGTTFDTEALAVSDKAERVFGDIVLDLAEKIAQKELSTDGPVSIQPNHVEFAANILLGLVRKYEH